MSLVTKVDELAAAIRVKINQIMPRLVPPAGATGFALTKASAADHSLTWADVHAGRRGLSSWCAGKPSNSEVVGGGVAPYAFTVLSANTSARAAVAATASTVFTIKRNNAVTVGTFTFNPGSTTSITSISSGAISAGDFITIVGPATADATLADIAFLVKD